jgi:type I restriction enzyme S subunit
MDMTQKAKAPAIRFKGFTNAWEQRKLSELYNFSQGMQVAIDDQSSEKTPKSERFIRIVDVTQADEPERYIINETGKGHVDEDDIFFVRYGAVGTVGIGYKGTIANNLFKLKPKEKLVPSYMYQYFSSGEFNNKLLSMSASTSMPAINFTALNNLVVRYPSIKEQIQIGTFFQNLDNLTTLHQRKLLKLKNIKKAMLEKMFPKNGSNVPEIRFDGFRGGWEQRKLGEMGKTFTGLTGKTKDDFGHGEAEFVTYMNIFSNSIASTTQTENVEVDERQNEVEYGDIFFTTSSETPEEVGMSSVWLGNKLNVYLNSFCFGYRPTDKLDPYYMAYMLRSPEVRRNFQFLAQGISRYNISKTKVMDMYVYTPKIEEQVNIGQFFINLDNLITLHQRKLEKLQNLKKACLEKMFA